MKDDEDEVLDTVGVLEHQSAKLLQDLTCRLSWVADWD